MAMNPTSKRRLAMAFVLGGAGLIGARLLSPGDEEPGIAAQASEPRVRVDKRARSPAAAAAANELQLARLEALRADPAQASASAPEPEPSTTQLFSPESWQPPAPPPVKPPPPPPPQAPAFPYTYFGGMTDDAGVRTAYFTNGRRVIALRAGDVVDTAYRIDAIDTQHMAMTYLPLEQSLQIQFGSSQ